MTQQPILRYAALLLLALPLTGTLACLNASAPPPTWRFALETREQLQGFGDTYAPNTPFSGDRLFDQPGAAGSQIRIIATTNSLGRYYAIDGRVPARWRFIWGGSGPCVGKFWEGNVPVGGVVELKCVILSGSFFDDVGDGFLLDYVPDEYWNDVYRISKGRMRIAWVVAPDSRDLLILFISVEPRKEGDARDPYAILNAMAKAGHLTKIAQDWHAALYTPPDAPIN